MNICLNCLLPCDNCLNQSFCISCSIGYLSQITLGQCVNKCEDNYYGLDLNRSCLSCTNNCSTCSVASYLCLSCPITLVLQNSACVPNCDFGLFNLSGTCYPCTYPCLTCSNSDYLCTSCVNSYILINSTC
jgi:proprotein convertase subtilisin/kexin type 5